MLTILALAQKDLRILVRYKSGIFFTLIWPLMIAVMFGAIFSGDSDRMAKIKVAIVDEDATPDSSRFAERLEKSSEFEALRANREQGMTLVRKGRQTAVILIPKGFSEASSRLFYGTPPRVEVWIDPSRKAEAGMLQGLLQKQAAERMQTLLSDRAGSRDMVSKALDEIKTAPPSEGNAALGRYLGELDRFLGTPAQNAAGKQMGSWQPLEVTEKAISAGPSGPHPRNSFEITFPQGILWGIIGCVMTFGIGIVSERTHGTMARLQMAPISRFQLLAGKALACFAALAVLQSGLFLIGRLIFHVRPQSWPLVFMAGFSAAAAFVGIMMLVSVLGKTEQAAAGAGWAVMMPVAMLGGGMIPLFYMPSWMAVAGNFSPAKWAILAMEGAIWRGFSLQEMLLPCGILLASGAACFLAGARAFRPTS
jgi:ABC-2 type transport system permease protein